MEMTLGPQGIDWGNVADWISILVNMFVGVSVFWLGHRTYELTKSATGRDEKTHKAQNEQESREGGLLLLLFRSEIGHFRIQLENALKILDRDAKEVGKYFYRREFNELIKGLEIPSIWNKQGRLHILPDEEAVLLVSLIGGIMPLQKVVSGASAAEGDKQVEADQIIRTSIRNLITGAKRAEEICEKAREAFNLPGYESAN